MESRVNKFLRKTINTILVLFLLLVISGMFYQSYQYAKQEEYYKNLYHYVTFDTDGGSTISTQKVLHGSSCSRPEEPPLKEGKTFVGWYPNLDEKKEYAFFLPVEDDITLYAKWEDNSKLKSIIITFDTGYDSKVSSMVVKKGESKSLPKLTRSGYIFKGWLNDNKIVTSTKEVKSSKVLTAYWQKVQKTNKVYKVTFDSDGGSKISSQNVEEGKTIKKPDAPTKKGYIFAGWYNGNKVFNFSTSIKKDIKLVAKWEKDINDVMKVFSVKFDSNGGSKISTQNIEYGKTAKYPNVPTRKGYTFVGWYLENSKYDFNSKVTKNITLVAQWKENADKEDICVVTFNSDGGSNIASQNVIKGQHAVKPSNPTKSGYTFDGWYLGNAKYDFSKNTVTSNITLKAKWSKVIKTYIVTFDSNGGSVVANQIVEENKTVSKPIDPVKSGYTFKGWYNGSKLFDFKTAITSDITLKAEYQKDPVSSTHIVTFNSNGGSSIASQTVVDGGTVTKPKNPTKSGYTFLGWYYGNNVYNFSTPVKSNITLVAHYQNNQMYTVTFNSDGGSTVSNQTVSPGDSASEPNDPVKNGYMFIGWYLGNNIYNFNSAVNGNITLVAHYQKIEQYTVTFNSNGGSNVSTQTIVDGGTATKPKNPTRSGYTFNGWYLGNNSYNFNTPVTSNITLVAKWTVDGISAAPLSYSKNTTGKWVFINNPEKIKPNHLADSNKRLIYRDSFSGKMELYYEHSLDSTTGSIYYVIRFYNPGTSNVTLSVNKSGISLSDSTWSNTWRGYYSSSNVTFNGNGTRTNSFVIKPKEVLYFYHGNNSFLVGKASEVESKATKIYGGFDGVLNLSATGTLEFAALAYKTNYANTDGSTYNGNDETGSTIAVYTGYYEKMPEVTNNLEFEINDTIKKGSNLNVTYNNKTYSSWLTNGTGAYLKKNGSAYDIKTISETYKNDMLNFKIKTASGSIITAGAYPEYKDSRSGIKAQYGITSRSFNIANWGVHYNENIKIKNTGAAPRKVSFRIKNASDKMGSTCNSTIVAISQYGNLFKRISSGVSFVAWSTYVYPGSSISVPTIVTLGGDSCGYVEKFIYVDE